MVCVGRVALSPVARLVERSIEMDFLCIEHLGWMKSRGSTFGLT